MTVVALGMDLMQIDRIEDVIAKRGDRFLDWVFTPEEQAYCERRHRPATHYAGRYAVKESVMKVLGTGWSNGVRWADIEVRRAPGAAPQVHLAGASAEIARRRGIDRIHITITHDAGVAAAVAVGESA